MNIFDVLKIQIAEIKKLEKARLHAEIARKKEILFLQDLNEKLHNLKKIEEEWNS